MHILHRYMLRKIKGIGNVAGVLCDVSDMNEVVSDQFESEDLFLSLMTFSLLSSLFTGDLEGKVKWLDNYQKVKQLRDALVWLPVWERDKRAFIPEVCPVFVYILLFGCVCVFRNCVERATCHTDVPTLYPPVPDDHQINWSDYQKIRSESNE